MAYSNSLQKFLTQNSIIQNEIDDILQSDRNLEEKKLEVQEILDKTQDKIVEMIENPDFNSLQILVLALQYDNFKGKMAVGRVSSGKISKNLSVSVISADENVRSRVNTLMVFDGLGLKEVEEVESGEIVMVAGLEKVGIGDTITVPEYNLALPRVKIDEPTIKITFGVNTSPFAGKEGKLGTSRQIRERLMKELETDVALRVVNHPDSSEKFIVSGRGELHLAVLIEKMRREGFELEISSPEVIYKTKSELIAQGFLV